MSTFKLGHLQAPRHRQAPPRSVPAIPTPPPHIRPIRVSAPRPSFSPSGSSVELCPCGLFPRYPPPMQTIKTIGVVGAGQMGGGIAQVAAIAGFKVLLCDTFAQ